MKPRIETLTTKKLVGKRLTMSFTDNKTRELWMSFMSRRKEINNSLTNDLISLQVYSAGHFINFEPARQFTKWATMEVPSFENIPTDMEAFTLVGGLYAVFDYKGSSSDPSI